jgi:hypothetical protein
MIGVGLALAPISPIFMACFWLKQLFGKRESALPVSNTNTQMLALLRNKPKSSDLAETNFHLSPAFGITAITVFVLEFQLLSAGCYIEILE